MAASVLTLTANPALDAAAVAEGVRPEVKLRLSELRRDPGGGGINVARAASRLGARTRAVFPAGGSRGRRLTELLEGEGVDCVAVSIADSIRENLTVTDRRDNAQYRFGMPGPRLNGDEVAALWAAALARVAAGGLVVASGSLPAGVDDEFYARLSREVRLRDGRMIVDASGDALRAAAAEGVYLLKPNLKELASLVGSAGLEDPDIRRAARRLVEEGAADLVVVSLGSGGAVAYSDETALRIASPTVEVDSRIGAGDSMVAGICYGLNQGMAISEALRWGVAAGTAAVMTPGTELCRADDVRRILPEVRAGGWNSPDRRGI